MQTEIYNKLVTRLNELLPERLELRFGCLGTDKYGNDWVYINDDSRWVGMDKMMFTAFPPDVILGTPPTLQEILRALDNTINSWEFKIYANGWMSYKTQGFEYNLALPVKDQSESTLLFIYKLIK